MVFEDIHNDIEVLDLDKVIAKATRDVELNKRTPESRGFPLDDTPYTSDRSMYDRRCGGNAPAKRCGRGAIGQTNNEEHELVIRLPAVEMVDPASRKYVLARSIPPP